VRTYQRLVTRIAVVAAAAALVASSAFADSRHQKETRSHAARQEHARQERTAPPSQSQRSYGLQHTQRSDVRSSTPSSSARSYERYRGSGTAYRGNNNTYYHGSSNSYHGSAHYGAHASYYHSGRISHYEPWHGGYRVYVAGSPFPFFVPFAYWDPFRFRIGLTIGLGGYYNPAGYYDYYGYAPPPPYYTQGPVASAPAPVSSGVLRGTVESVDYRAMTFVLRNEQTGNYVTVDNGGRENRDVRPGDYIEVQGTWNGSYFNAYSVAYLGGGAAPANPNDQYPR
jgi:hypothetical protein